MTKKVTLTGKEQKITFSGAHTYYWVQSLGSSDILASFEPGVADDKDDVLIVQNGGIGRIHNDFAKETIYLRGTGRVQIIGTNNAFPPSFNSGSKGGGDFTTTECGVIAGAVDYPIISLNLYGESVQDGTPTPESPVDIVSVGDDGAVEVTSCGKNLLEHVMANITSSGITFTVNADKSITANGTATDNVVIEINHNFTFMQSEKYIMSSGLSPDTISGVAYLAILDGKGAYPNNDVVIEQDETTTERIAVVVEKGTTVTNAVFKPMIRLEDTDDTYEPYKGSTATITSGLPLCSIGSICDELIYNADGTGKIIKRLYTYNFSGNEPFQMIDNNALIGFGITADLNIPKIFVPTRNDSKVKISAISNIGIIGSQEDTTTGQSVIGVSQWGETQYMYFSVKEFTDVSTIKGHLKTLAESGKPANLLYQLATPYEIELSATEMSELMQLQTYNGVTNIFNDNGAEMTVKVATNPLLSEYVMPVIDGITARYEARIAALESAIANN